MRCRLLLYVYYTWYVVLFSSFFIIAPTLKLSSQENLLPFATFWTSRGHRCLSSPSPPRHMPSCLLSITGFGSVQFSNPTFQLCITFAICARRFSSGFSLIFFCLLTLSLSRLSRFPLVIREKKKKKSPYEQECACMHSGGFEPALLSLARTRLTCYYTPRCMPRCMLQHPAAQEMSA